MTDTDAMENEYTFKGKHYVASYRGCNDYDNNELIANFHYAIMESGATVLDFSSHTFAGGGITFVFLLSESHCSVHTYPEHHSMFVDYFTCGDVCDHSIFHQLMVHYLQPKQVSAEVIIRQ
jgi:S-adenosylmethionine decarboxylase proenzyme